MELIIKIPDRTYDFIMGLNQHTFGSKYAHKDVQADIVKAVKESKHYNPSGDCISREALKRKAYTAVILEPDEKGIKEMTTRPKGEWIPMNPDCRGYSDYFKCSICGAYIYPHTPEKELDYNGCPYCFADMQKGGTE